MDALLIALLSGVAFIVAYHTYGRWLGRKVFNLAADAVCPSARLRDDEDFVPTSKWVVFGHHFTSIAGTGPIVGPAIAVMWGWLPALLWVVLGSIFIGAVHDFGALVVSLRSNGETVGQIAGRVLNKRVRLLFLLVLFMALTIVLAIFGMVIAAVFRQYPSAIFPCWVQIPIAVAIGTWLHKHGKSLLIPSILALGVMYLTVIFGDQNSPVAQWSVLPGWLAGAIGAMESALHGFNMWAAGFPVIVWVILLLVYSYIASVIPVWVLLQPRDYINSLQLLSALGLILAGLVFAAFWGGAPPVPGAPRQPLEIVAPMVNWSPEGAPAIFPFLFITIACGAISGFHCLVSSGTSSKQLEKETDARFVGYGSMMTEGFLAVLVILACVAGLGLGISNLPVQHWSSQRLGPSSNRPNEFLTWFRIPGGEAGDRTVIADETLRYAVVEQWVPSVLHPGQPLEYGLQSLSAGEQLNANSERQQVAAGVWLEPYNHPNQPFTVTYDALGKVAWEERYSSWGSAGGLASTVAAFVDGAANLLKAIGIPVGVAVALMGVLVASFAGTTMDTACRLQRYVIQELAALFLPRRGPYDCVACGYDLRGQLPGAGECPECGAVRSSEAADANPSAGSPVGSARAGGLHPRLHALNPFGWLANKHGATILAVVTAGLLAMLPAPGKELSWATSGGGGLILWPMFGATNQLLGGLAFLVIVFWLRRRRKPVWFIVLPLVFMLVMPAWAMLLQLPEWWSTAWAATRAGSVLNGGWALVFIAAATLVLEAWMVVEAVWLWPRVWEKGEDDGEG